MSSKRLEAADAVLMLIPKDRAGSVLAGFEDDGGLGLDLSRERSPTAGTVLEGRLGNARRTRLVAVLVDPGAEAFSRLETARKGVAPALRGRPADLLLAIAGLDEKDTARAWGEAAVAAALAAGFHPPRFRSGRHDDADRGPATITLVGHGRRLDTARLTAEAEGNALARYLTLLPPNMLTPGAYRKFVERLARREGWAMDFMDETQLRKRKAGAFLAVTQGSSRRDGGIVHLRYRPRGATSESAPLALVGKGICFDTGGVNLKPFKGMLDMHGDMQGSAVALGTFLALSRMGHRHPLDCWMALAENSVDAKAYKSHDVVTASDGTTIEVIHTDAEGRMVLADTLAIASSSRPAAIMDYATLTGACVAALTDRYSGVFSNRLELHQSLIEAGRDSGERVWPFPTDPDFDRELESPVADVRQCPIPNEGDHIMAARFLGRFVGDERPWVHVDLAASSRKGGLGHVPTEVTGFGVRFSLAMILARGFGRRRR